MRVTIAGYLTDHKSRVLLRQPGAAELAPVVASLETGRLPAETLARAFREATGLVVLPVRLVGLYFVARDGGELTLSYRCTLRGGELGPMEGQPPAGFFDTHPLPRGLADAHRRQLADALGHAGGPAVMAQTGGLRARLRRGAPGGPAADWTATARLVVVGGDGRVVWTGGGAGGRWRLPAAAAGKSEAPWAAAARLLRQLGLPQPAGDPSPRLIVSSTDPSALDFVFVAALDAVDVPGDALRLAAPDPADPQLDPADATLAAGVLAGPETTVVM